jgi:chromosome segregation ATPase
MTLDAFVSQYGGVVGVIVFGAVMFLVNQISANKSQVRMNELTATITADRIRETSRNTQERQAWELQQEKEQATRTKELMTQLLKSTEIIGDLRTQLATMNGELARAAETTRRIPDLEARIVAMQKQLDEDVLKLAERQREIESLKTQAERVPVLQTQLDDAKDEIARLRVDLDAEKKESAGLRERVRQLEALSQAPPTEPVTIASPVPAG